MERAGPLLAAEKLLICRYAQDIDAVGFTLARLLPDRETNKERWLTEGIIDITTKLAKRRKVSLVVFTQSDLRVI